MRLRFKPASIGQKPTPQHFGLPANFSLSAYQHALEELEERRCAFARWGTAISFFSTVGAIFLYLDHNSPDNIDLIWLMFSPIGIIIFYPHIVAFNFLRKIAIRSNAWELSFGGKSNLYALAYSNWQFTQTEAGFGYWQNLKGVEFERAVALFFNLRGCSANLTKTTGDGGIDVVLNVGNRTYWCQCKGLAKPVSVSEIRRIAGASLKSKGSAQPVMFATNGCTLPALSEAQELGVICIDGIQLSELASRPKISALK